MNAENLFAQELQGYGQPTSYADVQDLLKAMEANESVTDTANLTGIGALQIQSLENTMASLIASDKNLVLWKDVPKGKAFSTLEEYSVEVGYGQSQGWLGQMETPLESDPEAMREIAYVKFQRQLWKFSDISGMVKTIKSSEAFNKQAAIMRALRTTTQSLYTGNSSFNPNSIDGFEKIIENEASSYHVIDARGAAVTNSDFRDAAELIASNFGNPEGARIYTSPSGISSLASAMEGVGASGGERFGRNIDGSGNVAMGFSVNKIITPHGTMQPVGDVFLAGEYESRGVPVIKNPSSPKTVIEGATHVQAPATPSLSLAMNAATVAGSLWAATGVRPSGAQYSYRVAAGNSYGLSQACALVTMGSGVAAAGSCTLTITPAAGNAATYFEIYSEKVAGSGEFRLLGRVAASGSSAVTYVDKNENIPGTTRMFILDLSSVGERRAFRLDQLAPMHSVEYAKMGPFRWGAVNLYVTPKYYAPNRFVMIKNVPVSVESKSLLLNI